MRAKSIVRGSVFGFGLGALLVGTAIIGAPQANASDPEQKQAKSEQDRARRVCRNLTPSGSRLTRRVCRTQAEWDASANRAADGVAEHQIEQTTTYAQDGGPI